MDKNSFARPVAEILLRTGAVTINTAQWFVYTSGIKSPIYCDMRWLISFTEERSEIVHYLTSKLADEVPIDDIDVIAGVATSGIPYAAWVADRLGKPMVYVRESSKAHGKGRQIEGKLTEGQRVLVMEDMITTGGSAIRTAAALRSERASVTHCLAIFEYGLAYAPKAFEEAKISAVTLCTLKDLLQSAQLEGKLSDGERGIVESWLLDYGKGTSGV